MTAEYALVIGLAIIVVSFWGFLILVLVEFFRWIINSFRNR